MVYIVVPLVIAATVAVVILLEAIPTYLVWLNDWMRFGLRSYGGTQSNAESKCHKLRQIARAKKEFWCISRKLDVAVWDDEMAAALERKMVRHPKLGVVVIYGPQLSVFDDDENPVLEVVRRYQQERPSLVQEVRLNQTDERLNGNLADRDLFWELLDQGDSTNRPFITYYEQHVYDKIEVDKWREAFRALREATDKHLTGEPKLVDHCPRARSKAG